jgi:hypothetical protein
LDHLAIRGRLREVTLKELIEPLLPNGIEAATGIVVDSDGRQSSQIDINIYSTSLLPSFMRVGAGSGSRRGLYSSHRSKESVARAAKVPLEQLVDDELELKF